MEKTSSSRATVKRFDLFTSLKPLAKPERTPEGYLRVSGRLARVGVQNYERADGTTRRELRPPEEVFDPASLASFAMVPLTNFHPEALLDSSTAKAHTVGAVGENVRQDGDHVAARLMVTDADAQAAIQAGRVQLSCGYTAEMDETPGVWNGQPFDAIQRHIRGNHVALVDRGRGGPQVRLHLDSSDAVAVQPHASGEKPMPTRTTVHTIAIGDEQFEVVDPALRAAIGKLQGRLDVADTGPRHEAGCARCAGTRVSSGAICTCVGSDVASRADGAARHEHFVREVQARASLMEQARQVGIHPDDVIRLDDLTLKRRVLRERAPRLDVEKMDEARIDGAIEALAAARPSPADEVRGLILAPTLPRSRHDIADPQAARRRMHERMGSAWKQPSKLDEADTAASAQAGTAAERHAARNAAAWKTPSRVSKAK